MDDDRKEQIILNFEHIFFEDPQKVAHDWMRRLIRPTIFISH